MEIGSLRFAAHSLFYFIQSIFSIGATCLLFFVVFSSCQKSSHEQYVIGFSQCTSSDEWRRTMLEGMNRELSFYPDVKMIMKSAEGQSDIQVQQIQEFIDA